jgi:hypothetical protein
MVDDGVWSVLCTASSSLRGTPGMKQISTAFVAVLSAALVTYSVAAQNPAAPMTSPSQAPAAATPSGQAPGQGQQGQRPRGPRPAPTNIKALPKNITGDQLIKLMHQYEGDLGVECEFCHAQNPTTKRNDFASDANPTKDVARYMILMTADLNDKWLNDMPDRRYADPITCGTCHRGEKHPSVFVPAPQTHQSARPAAPAVTSPAAATPSTR